MQRFRDYYWTRWPIKILHEPPNDFRCSARTRHCLDTAWKEVSSGGFDVAMSKAFKFNKRPIAAGGSSELHPSPQLAGEKQQAAARLLQGSWRQHKSR
jgi:hypothetical protein